MTKSVLIISIIFSVAIYVAFLLAFKASGVVRFKVNLPLDASLPSTYIDGIVEYKSMTKLGGRIFIKDADGRISDLECYGADYKKYPSAIPCGETAFKHLSGRACRVWYLEEKTSLPIIGKDRRLAVQLKTDDERFFYSFDVEKAALYDARNSRNIKLDIVMAFLHSGIIFFLWFFIVCPLIKKD